jgi:hypothetical protein
MRPRLVALLVCLTALALPAAAAGQATVDVKLKPKVVLAAPDVAVATVSVRCTLAPGVRLLEGLVSVSQPQAFGFGPLNPPCDGKRHRIVVQVRSQSGLFEPGTASVSAFLSFIDEGQSTTHDFQDARFLRVRS